jgi:hypothetical protein
MKLLSKADMSGCTQMKFLASLSSFIRSYPILSAFILLLRAPGKPDKG